ncbi:hypothetical protein GWK47_042436 [Chionoecetes opilio]|uniref:Uncharacterized protein n=1 Tax=Chionoecetes opilio TaxID=41210 RepID=A0A8J4Y8V5_CHIOP|nr:hypothetical protein GWK47_042436 [Chionoecetes opilio]
MALALHEEAKAFGTWVSWLNQGPGFDEHGPTATEGTDSTRLSNKMGKELESWCSKKQRYKLLEQAMFPALSHAAGQLCLLSTTRPYTALQLWRDCFPRSRTS